MNKSSAFVANRSTLEVLEEQLKEFDLAYNLGPELNPGERQILENRFKNIFQNTPEKEIYSLLSIVQNKSSNNSYKNKKLEDISKIANFANSVWSERISFQEEFLVIALNKNHQLKGYSFLHLGGTDYTQASIKILFQFLLLTNAYHFVIVHNHPDSNLEPSTSDSILTRNIETLATIFEFNFVEHLIITPDGEYQGIKAWGEG